MSKQERHARNRQLGKTARLSRVPKQTLRTITEITRALRVRRLYERLLSTANRVGPEPGESIFGAVAKNGTGRISLLGTIKVPEGPFTDKFLEELKASFVSEPKCLACPKCKRELIEIHEREATMRSERVSKYWLGCPICPVIRQTRKAKKSKVLLPA